LRTNDLRFFVFLESHLTKFVSSKMASGGDSKNPVLSGTELILKIIGIEELQDWTIGFAQNPDVVEDFISSIGIYKTCDIYDSGLINVVFMHCVTTTLKFLRDKLRSYGFTFGSIRIRKTLQNPGQILAHYKNQQETKIYGENVPKANTSPDNENTSEDNDCDTLGDISEKIKDMYITSKDKLIKLFTKHHEQLENLLEIHKKETLHFYDKNRKDTEESFKKTIKKRVRFK